MNILGPCFQLVLSLIIFQWSEVEANSCPDVEGPFPVYIPHKDCTKFWQCSNGDPYLHNCPSGLHFNPNLNVCDWPKKGGCDAGRDDIDNGNDGELEGNATEENEVNICLQNNLECPTVDGKYPVYGALPDCTKFCQCSNGIPYSHDCPDGLHFNTALNVCDWPEKAGCAAENNNTDDSNDGITDSADGSGSEESTTEEAEINVCLHNGIECPIVDGEYPVYGALQDCTKFCQCSNGIPYSQDCPQGLHFNSALNVCDWPERAGCAAENNDTDDVDDSTTDSADDSENGESTTEEAEINVCLQNGMECPIVDGEYPVYGALPDCTKFCQCSNGTPYLHDCPAGLHFNPDSNVCDWPRNASCSSTSS